MDSKTDDAGKSNGDQVKKTGPAAPPPPSPLQPMKLPPAPASKAGADAPSGSSDADAAQASLAQRLVSTVVDDGDVIEKDWVDKARKIVDTYRGDPHRQSEELSILRASYMEKRFGKTIKLSK